MSSLHVGCDPLTNHTNRRRLSQIVDTPLKERNLIPGVTQYFRVAGRTEQSSNNTCFVTVVNGQLSPSTCGPLADETPSQLIAVYRPILVPRDAVHLNPTLLLRLGTSTGPFRPVVCGAAWAGVRRFPPSRDPFINTINAVLPFVPSILGTITWPAPSRRHLDTTQAINNTFANQMNKATVNKTSKFTIYP
jgi:hypothetical protein